MIRRVAAAVLALVLAGVGILLVVNYANRADERAMQDQETVEVLVATQAIPQGTAAGELGEAVEVREVPRAYVIQSAVASADELDDRVARREILPDEQISDRWFVSADELRREGSFDLPEEARTLHQLTVNIPNPRALGGSIAAGDLVGVFSTFDVEPTGWTVDDTGALIRDEDQAADGAGAEADLDDDAAAGGDSSSPDSITYTDLLLDKVLVVRVEGGFASAGEAEQDEGAADTVHVTMALEPQDAARVIFAVETGSLWLTLAPEDADDAEVRAIVPVLPTQVAGVVE